MHSDWLETQFNTESAEVWQEQLPYVYLALDPFPSQALLPKGALWALMSMTNCYKTTLQQTVSHSQEKLHFYTESFCPVSLVSSQFNLVCRWTFWPSMPRSVPGHKLWNSEKLQFEFPFDQVLHIQENKSCWVILQIFHCIYGKCKGRQGTREKGDKMQIFWILSLKL